MESTQNFDVIIVGGSYAGLSAGLILGRSLRKVLIINSGKPCNWQTPHSHSFLTRDGETPGQLAAIAREQVLRYPTVRLLNGKASTVHKQDEVFVVETETGQTCRARKLLLATGVTDQMPDIRGFAQCWGISVLHCPYCHGYEVHSQKIGLLANGDVAFEMVHLIRNWSKDLTLFTNGESTLTPEQTEKVKALPVSIVENPVTEIAHTDGYLKNIRLANGQVYPLHAVFARVPFKQHSGLAEQLGCVHTETGLIGVSEFGETSVKGVFAAGDNSSFFRQVVVASANAVKAAGWINRELIGEENG